MRTFHRLGWVLFTVTAGLLLVGVGTGTVQVSVNDIAMPGPYTVQNGQVVGPVAPVARALGAVPVFNRGAGTLTLRYSPWITVDREPPWTTIRPLDTTGLPPVITVNHHLAEMQWQSFMQTDQTKPLLARYEIFDVNSVDMVAPPGTDGTGGFTVLAYLYWASRDPARDLPLNATRLLIAKDTGYSQQGPKLRDIRVETRYFTAVPADVTPRKPTDLPENYEAIIQGAGGWKVTDSATTATTAIPGAPSPRPDIPPALQETPFPIYDLSVRKISHAWPGVSPHPDIRIRVKRR